MKRIAITATAVAAVLAAAAFAATPSAAHGPRGATTAQGGYMMPGYGGQGPGYGRHMGFGPGPGGQMGYGPHMGYGPGYGQGMGYGPAAANCPRADSADLDLGVDDVKTFMERRLAAWRNDNLKVGEITEKDENTITAEIVTKDGSLVERFDIDRKTGRQTRVQ